MPDATSLHHCLKNKQLKLNTFSGKDPEKEYADLGGVYYSLHMDNYYTYCVERRWHIPYNPPSARRLQAC